MNHQLLFAAAFLISAVFAQAQQAPAIPPSADTAAAVLKNSPRHGEWVDIPLAGSEMKLRAWVVYPERKEKAAAVLVIHEIFGLTDWARAVADQLAADGFIAVAPDFLSGMGPGGGGSESLGDDVRQKIRDLTTEQQVQRLDAAREYALALPSCNGKTASLGFCWGGTASFNYAASQPKLDAAVVFYGTAPTENEALVKIQCPVLGLYGGDDNRVTSTVEPTAKAMGELKKQYTSHVYEGAGHGFVRQQDGRDGANLKAVQQGWGEVVAFLKKNLE